MTNQTEKPPESSGALLAALRSLQFVENQYDDVQYERELTERQHNLYKNAIESRQRIVRSLGRLELARHLESATAHIEYEMLHGEWPSSDVDQETTTS